MPDHSPDHQSPDHQSSADQQNPDQQNPGHQSQHPKEPSKTAARRANPDEEGEPYSEPQPILDASSIQEQMDRGEGMAVDDVKTYHRTEK